MNELPTTPTRRGTSIMLDGRYEGLYWGPTRTDGLHTVIVADPHTGAPAIHTAATRRITLAKVVDPEVERINNLRGYGRG